MNRLTLLPQYFSDGCNPSRPPLQYQGVSRMTTSMKRRHRDRVVRRGLGMLIESDFYTTAAGREHFSNQIQSIRYW